MDDIFFPESKRNSQARSIMSQTGDNLEHRITKRVKDYKDFVYPSSLRSFLGLVIFSKRAENVASAES